VSIVLHEKLGVDGFLFNGSLSKRSRDKVIEDFKGTDGFSYLIASPMVGGVGLNLTEANHIIHYGRWWNPALERQCDARVHRKGQEKDVFIHHLIAKDDVGLSFDEKLHKMHQEKAAIADGLFGNVGSDGKGEQEFANDLFVRPEINKVPKFEGMKGFDHLSPEKFQRFATELVASLLGGIAIHPPFVGDKGADGLVVKKNEVYLLQAKHTGQLRRAIAASGIRELLRAYGDYSDYLIGLVSQLKEIYLVTNGILSTEARLRAVESSVNVIDRDNLGRLSGDLIAMGIRSAQNCRIEQSFDAVLHRLDDMLKKSA
jgi:hypothetical protein